MLANPPNPRNRRRSLLDALDGFAQLYTVLAVRAKTPGRILRYPKLGGGKSRGPDSWRRLELGTSLGGPVRGARVGGPREWIRKRERGRSNAHSPIDGGEGRHWGGKGRRTWEGSPALETTPISLEHCPMGCRFSATVDGEARKHLIRLCKRSIKLNRGKLVVRGKVSEPKYSQSERKGRMSWDVLAGSDLSLLLGALVLVAPFRRPPSSGSDQLQRQSVSQARPGAGGPQVRD